MCCSILLSGAEHRRSVKSNLAGYNVRVMAATGWTDCSSRCFWRTSCLGKLFPGACFYLAHTPRSAETSKRLIFTFIRSTVVQVLLRTSRPLNARKMAVTPSTEGALISHSLQLALRKRTRCMHAGPFSISTLVHIILSCSSADSLEVSNAHADQLCFQVRIQQQVATCVHDLGSLHAHRT